MIKKERRKKKYVGWRWKSRPDKASGIFIPFYMPLKNHRLFSRSFLIKLKIRDNWEVFQEEVLMSSLCE